jgi:hypothetical protein
MAHHAKVENGIVTQVIVTCDDDENTFADRMLAETGEQWVRTSYNAQTNGFRFNYAGVGMFYDATADAFYHPDPQCHDERILDRKIYQWTCTNPEHDVELFG